jgi:hypothetical protein
MSIATRDFVDSPVITRVTSSASNTPLLAASGRRQQVLLFNESTSVLYIKYGAGASATSYTTQVPAGGYWEMPKPIYRGQIDGIWASANGFAQITEGS